MLDCKIMTIMSLIQLDTVCTITVLEFAISKSEAVSTFLISCDIKSLT